MYKKKIFCPLYFGCPLCCPDPFRIRFLRHDVDPDPAKKCGSGSGQKMRIRPDPNSKHCTALNTNIVKDTEELLL